MAGRAGRAERPEGLEGLEWLEGEAAGRLEGLEGLVALELRPTRRDVVAGKGESGCGITTTMSAWTLTCRIEPRPPEPIGSFPPSGRAYLFASEREGKPVALRFAANGYRAFVLRYTTRFRNREEYEAAMAEPREARERPGAGADAGALRSGQSVASSSGELGTAKPSLEQLERHSPAKAVTSDAPPAFVWHTADDRIANVGHALAFSSAMARRGVPF